MTVAQPRSVLSRILDGAHTCRTAQEFRTNLLQELRAWVGCEGAVMRPGPRWLGSQPLYLDHDTRFTDAYVQEPQHYGRGLERWCALSRGSQAFVDSELHPTSLRQRLPIYAEVLQPNGITSILASPLSFRGEVVGLVLLFRRGLSRPFSTQAREALSHIIPSLALGERTVAATFGATVPLVPALPAGLREAFDSLGPRERQVARLLAQGLQSKEIASMVGTSPNTVRAQTQRIFEKLGVRSRTRLALWLREHGLAATPATAKN